MLIIVEGYKVGVMNNIVVGKTTDRVILYHRKSIEQLLNGSFTITGTIELLSSKNVIIDVFQVEQFKEVGVQL